MHPERWWINATKQLQKEVGGFYDRKLHTGNFYETCHSVAAGSGLSSHNEKDEYILDATKMSDQSYINKNGVEITIEQFRQIIGTLSSNGSQGELKTEFFIFN